ncbi:hypothetical protein [Hypericibacter sp.]
MANGFGCEAVRVARLSDLPRQLLAVERKTATIIEIMEQEFAGRA